MNRRLFSSTPGKLVPPTNTVNNAGGAAYARSNEEALAQLSATGCLGDTFYVTAETQLAQTLDVAAKCSAEWVAKCAVYARKEGLMKDLPALLCAHLATRDLPLLRRVFPVCIDNGKQLRNFVQAIRSGTVGRKSFGTAVKRLIQKWFEQRTEEQLFHASIGDKPSLGDVIKMVHPKPATEARSMMLAYLMGKDVAAFGLLPEVVQQFEFAKLGAAEVPDINFQFLSSMPLTQEQWGLICDRASWTTLRMNLNTFHRHGVFTDGDRLARAIRKLRDPGEIARAKPMPHQVYAAFRHAMDDLPPGLSLALGDAAELALANVPELPPNLVVGIDCSGSMRSAITGARGQPSKITCVETAALIGCAILRKNPTARLVPFDTVVHQAKGLGGSLLEAASTLAGYGGGGTDCMIPLQVALGMPKVDAVVIVSDNESWFGSRLFGRGSATMSTFRHLQAKSPGCRLVCIDIQPNMTTQVATEPGILNVGGFSDAVFDVMRQFLVNRRSWVEVIQAVDIGDPIR